MPYFCKTLRLWRPDVSPTSWSQSVKYLVYRLEQDDNGVLRWRLHVDFEWHSGGYVRTRRGSQFRPAVYFADAVLPALYRIAPTLDVRHGGKLTAAQAKKLTGIKDRAAWDRVHDDDHPRYRGAVETLPAEPEPADAP